MARILGTATKSFTFAILTTLTLVIATGCGGKDKKPPPKAKTKAGNEALPQLQRLVDRAQNACCEGYAPYMAQYGVASLTASTAGTSVNGGASFNPIFPFVPLPPPPPPANLECRDRIVEAELFMNTIDNGQYSNTREAQEWWIDQGRGVVNCVGARMAQAGLPIDPASWYLYLAAIKAIQDDLKKATEAANRATRYIIAIEGPPVKSLPPSYTPPKAYGPGVGYSNNGVGRAVAYIPVTQIPLAPRTLAPAWNGQVIILTEDSLQE